MAPMARRLPPLNAMRAFEAASRNASFTQAAAELCITQGAVSRHISALEAWLGVKLFVRDRRGIGLTPNGMAYARTVRESLDQLEHATRQLQQQSDEKTLRLKVPPTFAIRWLVPRLAEFHALNRNLDVQITTSHQPADFSREDVDACIHSDTQPPTGARWRCLFHERIQPVCSPRLLAREPGLATPADLAHHVLVSSLRRPHDWPSWLAAAGAGNVDGNNGIRLENSALAYQAAIDGVGVVIAQHVFVDDEFRSGRLVAPFALQVPTEGAYYFGHPADRPKPERVAAFEAWIVREAEQMHLKYGV